MKKIKELKIGEYFTIKPTENPKESQVYIRGEYDRADKKILLRKILRYLLFPYVRREQRGIHGFHVLIGGKT